MDVAAAGAGLCVCGLGRQTLWAPTPTFLPRAQKHASKGGAGTGGGGAGSEGRGLHKGGGGQDQGAGPSPRGMASIKGRGLHPGAWPRIRGVARIMGERSWRGKRGIPKPSLL